MQFQKKSSRTIYELNVTRALHARVFAFKEDGFLHKYILGNSVSKFLNKQQRQVNSTENEFTLKKKIYHSHIAEHYIHTPAFLYSRETAFLILSTNAFIAPRIVFKRQVV